MIEEKQILDPAQKVYLCVRDQNGRTFKLDAKSKPIKFQNAIIEDSNPKTYTTTITFKMDVKMGRKFKKYIKRMCFKRKKDYLLFKKNRKRLKKEVHRISNIKGFDNPRKLKSLDWLNKSIKKGKLGIWKFKQHQSNQ